MSAVELLPWTAIGSNAAPDIPTNIKKLTIGV